MSENKVLVTVNKLDIKAGAIYKIENKPDMNAPSGYREMGTTKLPSEGVGNSVPCNFVINNISTGDGVYDTGLYPGSPFFKDMDPEKRQRILADLKENLVAPYEAVHGIGMLDHTNKSFWDAYTIDLWEGRFLNTANVDDLLDLYIAMVGRELTPSGERGNPAFQSSDYMIVDKEKSLTAREKNATTKMDAAGAFSFLLKTKKPLLLNVLRYVDGVSGVDKETKDSTLKSLFSEWIEEDIQNAEAFNKAVELSDTNEGKELINLYSKLDQLFRSNKKVKKSEQSGEFEYDGTPLGISLKEAADNLLNKKDLEEIRLDLLKTDS